MAEVSIHCSTIIDAPIDAVWEVVRDFNGHDRWHPAVADSTLEGGLATDVIGAVRSFHLSGGEHLREQLLALSDREFSMSYCLLETPIPLNGYVAHLKLKPVTESGSTYWEWHSTFDAPAGREDELAELVSEGVYQTGFDAIGHLLARKRLLSTQHRPTQYTAPESEAPRPSVITRARTMAPIQSDTIVMNATGAPDVLAMSSQMVAQPGSHEVRLRHTAIGVNYIDIYCRSGLFQLFDLPGTPGLEASAVVLDVGDHVNRFAPGDRVAYASMPAGAYCSVRNVSQDRLVRLPDDISDQVAAGAMVKGLTAGFLLHEVRPLMAGESILIHAAAGGVGSLLVQWARAIGAHVIGTVGSPEKESIALSNGCDHVINYNEQDFVMMVQALTDSRGVDVVIDGVGQQTFEGSLASLANRGHLISYGQASGAIGSRNVDMLAAKSLTLSRPGFDHYTESPAQLADGARRLFQAIRQGILNPQIGRTFPLSQASEAHRWVESRQGTGANLLLP